MAVVNTLIGNIKGPKGDTGATGAAGAAGATGADATVSVGSTTTVPYGQAARVTNSGTPGAAVFNFTIPQGKPGEQTTKLDALTLDALTEPSTQFPVPAVGDNGSTLFGKISKWFSDMSALVATKLNVANVVNNLTTTASGYALDARQGKILADIITPTVTPFTTVSIGSTYQIPENVLAHKIIVISMVRYGYGGSFVTSSELIKAGFVTSGLQVNRGSATTDYWMAKISTTGELTLLSSSTTADAPNIQIVGML